ncbi:MULTISPECIES: exonuclease SbcCD subunit D [unclassified Clostridium]|uniref:exonuclease SbcCD subunit D n=1 Tax=unclassified Clostridium TaxID=2614128 RepID=UPI001EEE3CFC|nr:MULTISPECIES: exonuclease SbcCD subunit D [unclassified Clostridium]
MKFIHTADWHIGKIVNEFSMLEDQAFILSEFVNLVEEERPDAVIIAGDLYDRSVPPADGVDLLDKVLSKIVLDLKIPVLAVAGNHDSPERLSFGSSLLKNSGLHIEGVLNKNITKVSLKDKDEITVNFYLVPYTEPAYVRELYGDENIKTHEEAYKKVIEDIYKNFDRSERNVLITHGYVSYIKDNKTSVNEDGQEERAGLITSASERPLSIGGTDLISAEIFSEFDYVALGHLHRPQKVGSDKIRYSGSLLKYSTSEAKQKKSITIVNIDKSGELNIELKELRTLRDLRIIKGPLNELICKDVYKETNTDDYVFAILADEGELLDPISKLRAVYPNIMGLSRESFINSEYNKTSAEEGYKNKSKEELFSEFYKILTGKELDESRMEVLRRVIEEVQREII